MNVMFPHPLRLVHHQRGIACTDRVPVKEYVRLWQSVAQSHWLPQELIFSWIDACHRLRQGFTQHVLVEHEQMVSSWIAAVLLTCPDAHPGIPALSTRAVSGAVPLSRPGHPLKKSGHNTLNM